jgi:membrane protease YdiL (CAAX protease family)
MSTLGAARPVRANLPPYRSERPVRDQVASAAWLIGLTLVLTVIAFVAGAPPAIVPFILAIGPAVIAIVLAWREGHGALRQLLRSLTNLPARKRWYLALAIPVLWAFATVAVGVVLGAPTAGLLDKAFPAVLIIFLVVLLPALAEELAWRGFVLPRLMSAMSPLQAALVLAVPWTLVHVGLHLPGQMNEVLILWPLVLSIVSYSVILAWVFVRTGGSVLMTALIHAGLNAMSPVMVGIEPNTQWVIRNILAALIAVAVVALGGFSTAPTPTSQPADEGLAPVG